MLDVHMRLWCLFLVFVPLACVPGEASAQEQRAETSWLRLDTLFTVGLGADEPPESQFGRIISIAVDTARDRVAVLDALSHDVRLFGTDGHYITTLGRSGDGPGEYRLPSRAAFDPRGALFVYDPMLGRVSAYTSELEFQENFRLPGVALVTSMVVTDEHLVVSGLDPGAANPKPVHVFTKDGRTLVTSFGSLSPAENSALARGIGPGSVTLTSGGDIWYTDPVPYTATKFSLNGRVLGRIEHPERPIDVPGELQEVTTNADGSVMVRPLVFPRALWVIELEDGWLLSQANPMDGQLITDLWNPDLQHVATQTGPIPGLAHFITSDLVVVKLRGEFDQDGWGLVKLKIELLE